MTKRLPLVLCVLFLTLGSIPAYAVDLNAELSSKGITEKPVFRYVNTAFVDYHNGGKLRDALSGKNVTISFTADLSNPSIRDLVGRINNYLSHDLKSSTRVTDLLVTYRASLVGENNTATIDYSLTLMPSISKYIAAKYSDDTTVIDAAWIGMSLDGPVVIHTAKYGDVEVGNLAGFVYKIMPNLEISDSRAQQVLGRNLIDSSSLSQQPVSNWQHLFDPAYIITETSSWGYNGSKIAITTFNVGESRIGITQNNEINTVDFTTDKNYQIQTVQHASSATIQVDGQATLAVLNGTMAITTTPKSVNENPLPSTGLSVQTIYAMAGFAAVLAGGIFWWSNKKMKESLKRGKDSGPPTVFQYEERKHWADRFDEPSVIHEENAKKSPI